MLCIPLFLGAEVTSAGGETAGEDAVSLQALSPAVLLAGRPPILRRRQQHQAVFVFGLE